MSVPKREAGSGDKVPEGSLVELGSGQEENGGWGWGTRRWATRTEQRCEGGTVWGFGGQREPAMGCHVKTPPPSSEHRPGR